MRAIVVEAYGGPEVLQVREMPAPRPAPGQVLITVAYAGVNYAEVQMRRGMYGGAVPFVPGLEVSGHVAALGEGVVGLHVGQPVAAFTVTGGYAEQVVAPALLTFPLATPDGVVELTAAAGFPTIVPTAYALLHEVARLQTGESVLVHAAAGGVGTVVAQVARYLGAGRVYGTVGSPEKVAYARQFAYDAVYLREGFVAAVREATDGMGVNVALDSVGGAVFTESIAVLAPLGRIVRFGNASGAPDPITATGEFMTGNTGVLDFNSIGLSLSAPARYAAIAADALRLLRSGAVRLDLTDILPLEHAAEAHRRLEDRTSTGKFLLTIRA